MFCVYPYRFYCFLAKIDSNEQKVSVALKNTEMLLSMCKLCFYCSCVVLIKHRRPSLQWNGMLVWPFALVTSWTTSQPESVFVSSNTFLSNILTTVQSINFRNAQFDRLQCRFSAVYEPSVHFVHFWSIRECSTIHFTCAHKIDIAMPVCNNRESEWIYDAKIDCFQIFGVYCYSKS